jgi:hypothetical protein
MQLILDNLAAVMIFGTISLVVLSTQINSTQTTVETTISYASKNQILSLGSTMEEELKQIGQGTVDKIDESAQNGDGQTTKFVFWRNNGIEDLKIEYRLVATDTVLVAGDEVKRYRMDRYENDVYGGGSAPTLRDFVVETLDATGNIVGVGAAVLVRARIRDTYPMGDPDDMHIGSSFWGMTLRPENL